jgi:hypothetical protein
MTLQKDTAPEVKVEEKKITVGGQTVTFYGEKLMLAK